MTPERWQRVEELYHEAYARPPDERAAFLARVCADDEALRRDVVSLLNESDSEDGFLAGPALIAPAEAASVDEPAAMAGRLIGTYHLQALLGAGGMGEVYRARDTRLDRHVAIKILPRAFTSDPDRLARFEREARMLAALNHPNICGIYGLEQADSIRFLVLELAEGETLAQRLASTGNSGLRLLDVVAIARQILDALEAAHERGIIHRDLKPANINITPGGVVKVLDFGLAKPLAIDGSAPDLTRAPLMSRDRRDGILIGTAAYMSPEQARGLPVDKRTDVWAFGCVLYEMLTGRAAFAGATVSDTLARILEREPDWSALPTGTPAPIRRLLLRCLAKDPKQRLRDVGDVRMEIDSIDQVVPAAFEGVVSSAATRPRATWLPWIVAGALVTGVGVWEARRLAVPVTGSENPFANAQFTRFTAWEGSEGGADISPDGRFVAFLADRERPFDIWRSQVGTENFVALTSDLPPRAPPANFLRSFGFSGDAADIWFSISGTAVGRKMLLPLTGGTPRPFLGAGATTPSWSPDGERLAYITISPAGDSLSVADGTGADAREIVPLEEKVHNHNPVWSPDGEWIYFARGLDPSDAMDIWRIRPSGGPPERLTQQNTAINFLAPLDSRTLLYVARAENWSGPWLWALDVENRITRRVSVGVEQYTSVAASRDGRRVVVTVANPAASLWRVPLRDLPAGEADAEPYPVPPARALAPRFGGTSLFYLAASGVGDGLWREQDGQSVLVRKGADGALFEPPVVSRDGSRVAVILRKDGKRRLVIMSADGTDSRTLAASIDVRGTADWSPDGNWIVTGGSDEQGAALFMVPVDGGLPLRIVSGQAFDPTWSPSGNLIVYAASEAGQVSLLGVRPDGTRVEMPAVQVRPAGYRFLPDGTGIVYLPHISSQDFWVLNLAMQTTRQVTRLGYHGTLQSFDLTPDGKFIVFDRLRDNSDIVLIDLPK
jgi:Tol biopolymer transport system component